MIYSIPAAIVIMGLLLLVPAVHEPRYLNPDWRQEFERVDTTLDESGELSRRFYARQAESLNPAAQRADQGRALISLGASVAALLLALRVRTAGHLRELKTPSTARAIRWMATIAWWAWVPAQCAWFSYTFDRGDYPWWADQIAIPIAGSAFFCLLGFPFLLWGVHIAARATGLPVQVVRLPGGVRGVVATIVSVIPLTWFVFAGSRALLEGDIFTMPVAVGGVYATMVVWAAASAQRVA